MMRQQNTAALARMRYYPNYNGRISDVEMSKWRNEYKAIRCDFKDILSEMKRNPIDVKDLDASFDVSAEYAKI